MEETWKDILGFEGEYQVSNLGSVKSLGRMTNMKSHNKIVKRKTNERILKPGNYNGYLQVYLSSNGKVKPCTVHRLVAQAFLKNCDNKTQVNHINGIKNDNRVENLEWCTASENQRHKFDVLSYRHSEETKSKLYNNDNGSKKIKVNGKEFNSMREASLHHGKNKGYFSEAITTQKEFPEKYKQWKIEFL